MFEKLGKFEIKRVLGNGPMGDGMRGVDPAIGREAALQTILPPPGRRPGGGGHGSIRP